jgi:hypothetical protein
MLFFFRLYDPLHYVLLNIYGEFGWNIRMYRALPAGTDKTVSAREFYAFYLMIRPQETTLHYAGALFQQWCVDQYAKIELNRLNYIRL